LVSSKEFRIKIITAYYPTPYGELLIGEFEGKVCLCDWRYRKMRDAVDKRVQQYCGASYEQGASPVLEDLKSQLEEYFNGDRTTFDIELLFCGSDFQKRVWAALVKIPFGKTVSYLELSRRLGDEKAIRAVASANGANAISILVPCHRIIGSNGELTGYAGGLPTKKQLLKLERALPQLDLF
jgi:methylated-DNA-[protein]-cysteine S-methyltransferase